MYSPNPIAASFTLTASYYVSTIDVVLRTPTVTSFTTFNFSLQNSLTAPFATFASVALTAPAGGVSTQTINVNATLQAGTYYLTGIVPAYAGATVTSGDVDGWMLSNGIYNNTAGTVTSGLWVSTGSSWFLNTAGAAPAFSVNGALAATVPTASSVGPASGSGASQTFTFAFTDTGGYQNLSVLDVLINNALDGRQACYVAFVPTGASSGTVLLVDDAGDAGGPFQSLPLPGAGTASNGQCTISGTGSSVEANGTSLNLTLAITFSASFAGNKVVYAAAREVANNSGWQALATWGVPGSPPGGGPGVGGMNPAHNSNLSGSYTFTFTDTNGWQDIAVTDVLINFSLDGRQACYVAFVPTGASSGTVLLVDDAGDAGGPFLSLSLPGSGTISNSACSISGTGGSVNASGTSLTLTLAITFHWNFAGNRVFYLATRSNALSSGWQAAGTVTIEGLSAPQQLAPPDGSVFSVYPRTTTLSWATVVNAATYGVEIDCFQCCVANQWCTDVGGPSQIEDGLKQPSYTFNFVGAQPGRWRVWATDGSGHKGAVSGWWGFRYTM